MRNAGRLRSFLAATAAVTTTAAATITVTVAAVTTSVVISAAPAYALANGLARTPPMGFNNWNTTACRSVFNESMVMRIIDIFVNRGLRDVGYQYVNLDDCWAVPAPNSRDANGNLKPDPNRFPRGIKFLADYAHARGLKLGIYTSAGTKTCNTLGFSGGLDHEQQDAALFASWGIDYLKYDNCNNQGVDAQLRYTRMRDALLATGRPIAYSITEWGRTGPPKVWEWGKAVGNLWRTTGDISDNWGSMIGKAQFNRTLPQWAGPGHWNDPDMLEVGNGGMTAAEYRTHFSLWAIMASPLLIGSDLRNVSEDTFTILKNTDVIAVDQDPLGRQATVVSNSGGLVVYGRTLANGDRAVALSNETTSTATISTTAAALGLAGSPSYTLKDLWTKSTRTTTGTISASVPGHATVLYRVSRPGTTTRFEAEAGTIGQGVKESDHSGFSGTGYVNYNNAVGSSVQWTVSAAQAGPATLVFDYGNGTTTNRPMDITVNGNLVADELAFNGTGAWPLWRQATVTTNLNAGANVIRATATTANGGPNLDYLDVHVNGGPPPPPPPPPPPGDLQAEDAMIIDGVVESNHAGFMGTGFVNYNNVVGSAVEFSVTAAQAGPATVTFRFANGTTVNRPMDIIVNGTTAVTGLAFNPTGAWTTWQTTTATVNLNAGTNTLRARATTVNGGPNLDMISLG